MLTRLAFNDMFGKGWDSSRQESFCWQKWEEDDPQFWWVPHVFKKWGHAHDWAKHKRDDKGRYLVFPKSSVSNPKTSELAVGILRLAAYFPIEQAEYAEQLIQIAKELDEQE